MLATDNSVTDPRLLAEIEHMIVGQPGEIRARFYEHAKRDHRAEAEQQQRIKEGSDEVARPFFKSAVYIETKAKGQIDFAARPATDQDQRDYPREWAAFQATKNTPPKHSINLLPGNTVVTQAIFDELRLQTIEDFIEFTEKQPKIMEIFTELAPLLEAAKRWRTFMKPRLRLVNGEVQ